MEEQAIELPELPETNFHDNGDEYGHERTYGFTADQMQAYARAAVLAERERIARWAARLQMKDAASLAAAIRER